MKRVSIHMESALYLYSKFLKYFRMNKTLINEIYFVIIYLKLEKLKIAKNLEAKTNIFKYLYI